MAKRVVIIENKTIEEIENIYEPQYLVVHVTEYTEDKEDFISAEVIYYDCTIDECGELIDEVIEEFGYNPDDVYMMSILEE